MARFSVLSYAAVALTAFALVSCTAADTTVTGSWGKPGERGEPSLVFEEDGSVHGNDGCNNLMGQYEVSGSDVSFGPLASTLMFCEGVDTWLTTATTGSISGDTLELFDEAGESIGSLPRSE